MNARLLQKIAREHGTPVVVIDHEVIRRSYASFQRHLPKVQVYYAVKANPAPEIIRTLYQAGASFDVASLAEFMLVYENIKRLPAKERQQFIWDKIVYANPVKPKETLQALDRYKPLVTFDNRAELDKIRRYAPHAGLALRLRVPNTGSMVELSSKFGCDPGEAVDLIEAAFGYGLVVEAISFHVGSQCTNFDNFVQALNLAAAVMREAASRGREIKILDIGGGFPVPYERHVKPLSLLAKKINAEIARLFPPISKSWLNRDATWWPQPPLRSPPSSAKPCATARSVTTSTTASITPTPESSSITASTRSRRSRKEKPRPAPFLGRLAMVWTLSPTRRSCPSWTSAIWSMQKTSALTAAPPAPGLTVFRRQN